MQITQVIQVIQLMQVEQVERICESIFELFITFQSSGVGLGMSGLKHLLFQSEISNDKFPICLKKHFLMVPLKIDLVCAFHKC